MAHGLGDLTIFYFSTKKFWELVVNSLGFQPPVTLFDGAYIYVLHLKLSILHTRMHASKTREKDRSDREREGEGTRARKREGEREREVQSITQ